MGLGARRMVEQFVLCEIHLRLAVSWPIARCNVTKSVEFRFQISAFTPETLPMQRLGQYLLELAALLGEKENVHFGKIEKGSAILVHHVEYPAAPKVRDRLKVAALSGAPDDIRRHQTKIDEMLAADNATGELREAGREGVILKFRGRDNVGEIVGPISEDGAIDGILVRIGGEDNTAHAHLVDGEKRQICVVSREMARQISPHLYGEKLRLAGRGRWRRSTDGQWQLLEFRAHSFVVLTKASLTEVQGDLAALHTNRSTKGSVESLLRIRRNG